MPGLLPEKDTNEPSFERGFSLELSQAVKGAGEGFLNDVFGIRSRPQHAIRNREHERAKRIEDIRRISNHSAPPFRLPTCRM